MDQSSANQLRHHHHQLQVVGGSSSSSSSSSSYNSSSSQPTSSAVPAASHGNNLYGGSAATGGDHGWTHNFTLCNPLNNNHYPSDGGGLVNPRVVMAANQDHLSFQWNTNSNRFTTTAAAAAAIKEEEGSSLSSSTTTSSDPFPRFTDMLITTNSPSSATTVDDTSSSSSSAVNSSSTFGYHGQYQFLPFNPSFANYGSGTSSSSMIYPSINVASLNQTDVNLQASLDQNLLFGALLTDHHHHHQTVNPYHGADHPMPQYCSPTTNKVSSSEMISDKGKVATESEEREVKRCNSSRSVTTATATQLQGSGANKKSKVDQQTRASCPPFKVRKEKLGDRITALQQLVAPFGKTDTASVLMEAIGYINFLQNQVETLSVPYMKSTRNKPPQSMHFQSAEGGTGEGASRDLRSRGLCLVPLSCTSYITNIDTGASGSYSGAMWPPPPPHFGQGTYNL